jgi:hypothetical protein
VGTVGVDVSVGGGVSVGNGVCVATSVAGGWVGSGVFSKVGVSVAGVLDGRLQASMAKTSARVEIKVRDFIVSPLLLNLSYLTNIPLAIDHLDSASDKMPHLFFFWSCLRKFSILRMNLYSGGPSRMAITTNRNKNSSHPIAITGSQASVLNKSTDKPINPRRYFSFMDYFNIGILIP